MFLFVWRRLSIFESFLSQQEIELKNDSLSGEINLDENDMLKIVNFFGNWIRIKCLKLINKFANISLVSRRLRKMRKERKTVG